MDTLNETVEQTAAAFLSSVRGGNSDAPLVFNPTRQWRSLSVIVRPLPR